MFGIGKLIAGGIRALSGVAINFEEVERILSEIKDNQERFENDVNASIQQSLSRVDEAWRGSGAEMYKEEADALMKECQDIPSELQSLYNSISAAVEKFREAEQELDNVLSVIEMF